MAIIKRSFFTAFLLSSLSLSVQAQINLPANWESSLYSDHSLVGKIWDSAADKFVTTEELLVAIERTNYLLLGEKHDNPDHHLLQLAVFNYLLETKRVSSTAFEMMDSDQIPQLQEVAAQQIADLEELKSALSWDEEGWDWEFYGPLLLSAHRSGVEIVAANINGDTMMQVYSEPVSEEIAAVLAADAMMQLELDIDESHCGLLPESQFPSMVRVQLARDNAMAKAMGEPELDQLKLLFAGNYHVRHDLSVPNYLLAQNEGLEAEQVLSLAFMEVDPSEANPGPYLQQFGESMAYNYIWFTPAISNEDYCASLQQ